LGIDIPVFALAKKKEEVFPVGRSEPLYIDRRSPVLHLLQRVRDETHQTAVGFHRQRREAAALQTQLTGIPGIGKRLAERLLNRFGSVERLREAPLSEVAEVIGRQRAEKLQAYLSHD
jgi:excinuclease ABC subunit C